MRMLAVGLALTLTISTANATFQYIWKINANGPLGSYMAGATIAVSGEAGQGVATVQQEYSTNMGMTFTGMGNAVNCTVTGNTWNQSFTATVIPGANNYNVVLAPPSGKNAMTRTYTVF